MTTPELQTLQKTTPPRREQCSNTVVARLKILGFHPEDSPRSQNNAFNNAIVRHNQLRPNLGFSPWKVRTLNFTYLAAPTCILLLQNSVHQGSPSTIQRLEPPLLVLQSGFHDIPRLWFHHVLECDLMATRNKDLRRSLLNQTVGIKAWVRTTECHPIQQTPGKKMHYSIRWRSFPELITPARSRQTGSGKSSSSHKRDPMTATII
jgi:hypothetical protein